MKTSFFIDEHGIRYSAQNSNHIMLANSIIEKNPELKEEFLRSGEKSGIEFMMRVKRFMAGVEETENKRKEITYDSEQISENQKKWIIYYRKNGYSVLDLAEFRTNSKKGNLDRGED